MLRMEFHTGGRFCSSNRKRWNGVEQGTATCIGTSVKVCMIQCAAWRTTLDTCQPSKGVYLGLLMLLPRTISSPHPNVLVSPNKKVSLRPLHTDESILLQSVWPQVHPPSTVVPRHSLMDHLGLVHRAELVWKGELYGFGGLGTNYLFLSIVMDDLRSRITAYSLARLNRCGPACQYLGGRSW